MITAVMLPSHADLKSRIKKLLVRYGKICEFFMVLWSMIHAYLATNKGLSSETRMAMCPMCKTSGAVAWFWEWYLEWAALSHLVWWHVVAISWSFRWHFSPCSSVFGTGQFVLGCAWCSAPWDVKTTDRIRISSRISATVVVGGSGSRLSWQLGWWLSWCSSLASFSWFFASSWWCNCWRLPFGRLMSLPDGWDMQGLEVDGEDTDLPARPWAKGWEPPTNCCGPMTWSQTCWFARHAHARLRLDRTSLVTSDSCYDMLYSSSKHLRCSFSLLSRGERYGSDDKVDGRNRGKQLGGARWKRRQSGRTGNRGK